MERAILVNKVNGAKAVSSLANHAHLGRSRQTIKGVAFRVAGASMVTLHNKVCARLAKSERWQQRTTRGVVRVPL